MNIKEYNIYLTNIVCHFLSTCLQYKVKFPKQCTNERPNNRVLYNVHVGINPLRKHDLGRISDSAMFCHTRTPQNSSWWRIKFRLTTRDFGSCRCETEKWLTFVQLHRSKDVATPTSDKSLSWSDMKVRSIAMSNFRNAKFFFVSTEKQNFRTSQTAGRTGQP